jgi:hypothetical protein
VDQLFNSSEKRLARLLIMLAQVGREAELRTVVTPISPKVMAARVGTTRSRINYFLNKFRELGLIEYNGHIAPAQPRCYRGAGACGRSADPRPRRRRSVRMFIRRGRSTREG